MKVMSTDEKVANIHRIFEVIDSGRFDELPEYFAEDYVEHTPFGDVAGREAFTHYVADWRAAFPDARSEVSDVLIDGDLAYWTTRTTGTNTGSFNGMPPTGQKIDAVGLHKGLLRDGLAVEHWQGNDVLTIMVQIGVIPAPVPQ